MEVAIGVTLRQLILGMSLALPVCVLAGANVWTAADVPGASVVRVQFDPQNADRMLAVSPSGLYRSVDAGMTWQLLNGAQTAPFNGLAIHPVDGNRVVVGTGSELYASQSGGGLPWTRFAMSEPRSFSEVAYSRDGSAVYAIHGADVFRSTDSGLTWVRRGTLPASTGQYMQMGPAGSETLYVASIGVGIFVSTDGGATWQAIATQPPGTVFTAFVASPANPARLAVASLGGGLYISPDGGAHWSVAPLGSEIRSVASDPSQPDTLFVIDGAGSVGRSTNGGGTWSGLGTISMLDFPRMAISPARGSRLAVSQGTTILFSDDGGLTWEPRSQGLKSAHVVSISNGSDRSYLGLRGSDFAWIESGSSVSHWLDSTPLKTPGPLVNAVVTAVPGTPDVLLAVNDRGLVMRSTNLGSTWAAVADLPTSLFTRQIVVSRTEPRVLYAVTPTGIMRSIDRGASWNSSNAGLSASSQPLFLAVGPGATVYAAVFQQQPPNAHRVYVSSDAGMHWNQAGPDWTNPILGLSAHPVDPLTVYAQGHVPSDLLRSRDGGQTWTPTNLCCVYGQVTFDPRDARIVYAASSQLVFRSVDGGDSWRSLPQDALVANAVAGGAFALDPRDPDSLLFSGGLGFGLRQLRVTPDLVLTGTAPVTAIRASPVTVSLTVRNAGPFDATHVLVSIQVPGNATGIAVTAPGATCNVGTTASCTFDTLRDSASAEVSVTATPAGEGNFVVSASVSADQPELVPGNNAATATVSVGAATAPPPSGGGGNGGGGGVVSWQLLALLALMLASLRRAGFRFEGHGSATWPSCPATSGIPCSRSAARWAGSSCAGTSAVRRA